ncbi:MAG: ABC transporter permease subunit [Bacteroidales bacterium]|nr:ABC transporter permease subunit [Bacteroidales bacterium]
MIRLFNIEWIKLRKYKAFQILTALYFLIVVVVTSSGMFFLEYLKSKGAEFHGIDPTILPIYQFPYLWQHIVFVAARLKILLAFLIIMSITNEFTYKTMRQNIIDGLSRTEYVFSKLSMIFVLSLVNTLLVFIIGLVTGLIYSDNTSIEAIFGNIQYLGAFFMNVFAFLVFTMFLSILIRRTGVVIIFLGMYSVIIEPILTLILSNAPFVPPFYAKLVPFFPREAITNLIPNPFPQYILQQMQDHVAFSDVTIAGGEMLIFIGLIFLMLKRRQTV